MTEKEIHEGIVEHVFALSEKNHGSIPVPVDNADDYFEIGLREEQRMGSMIDELFDEEKDISLHPPYRGIV